MIYSYVILFIVLFSTIDCLPIEIDLPTTIACYQSLDDPEMFFEFATGFPTAPWYILADIEYTLLPFDQNDELIEEWVTHHLMLVNRECPSSLKFSDGGIKFKLLKIRINMYLGYRHSPFLDFRYDFYSEFKYDLDRLIDVHGRVYLFVEFELGKQALQLANYVSLEQVMEELRTKKVETSHLCVTAEDQHFIIEPIFAENDAKIDHITSITARLFHNKEAGSFVTWTAYGCVASSSDVPGDIYFTVDKLYESTSLKFTIRNVDTVNQKHDVSFDELQNEINFITPDVQLHNLSDIDKFPIWARKNYIMDLNKSSHCPGNADQYVYYTKYREPVYGYSYETAEATKGAKQHVWVLKRDVKKCRIK